MLEFAEVANAILRWGGGAVGVIGTCILARQGWEIYGPSKWNKEPFSSPEMKAMRADVEARKKALGIDPAPDNGPR